MRQSRLGLQRSEQTAEPTPPTCSEVAIAFGRSVLCCEKGLGMDLAETMPKVKNMTLWVANLTGLDWSARFLLPVAFAIFYFVTVPEAGDSSCSPSYIPGADHPPIGCVGSKWQ